MGKRLLIIVVAVIVCTAILPICVYASSWEDQLDDSWQIGFEEGYSVGWEDAECAMESYAEDKLDEAYDYGYSDGFKAGMLEAERQAAEEKEEMRSNRMSAYFSVAVVVAISFVVTTIDKRKSRKK